MRMFLQLDSPLSSETNSRVHNIYEFDLNQYLTDGFTVSTTSGYLNRIVTNTPQSKPVASCKFEITNNSLLYRYLSTNIPHHPYSQNDILTSVISPYDYVDNVSEPYYHPSAYYIMEEVSGESAPSDWNSASNYFVKQTKTVSGHTYETYRNLRRTTYDNTKTYYKDTTRSGVRKYYTHAGYSFYVYRFGGDTSDYTGSPGILAIGGDGNTGNCIFDAYSTGESAVQVYRNNPVGSTTTSDPIRPYKISATTSNSVTKVLEGTDPSYEIQNGVLCFLHFKYTDPDSQHTVINEDYYGMAIISFNDESDTNIPTGLKIIAFTPEFWGDSIIPGGGGEGVWGDDGPPSYAQGGNGSWSAPSNNRGDENGIGVLNISNAWDEYQNSFSGAGYHRYQLITRDPIDSTTAFQEMCQNLWDPDIIQGFKNYFMSPLESILVCHMMPQSLCPTIGTTVDMEVIQAANLELSEHTVPILHTITNHKHVGSISVSNYTGSFADYTNTSVYIHLPYIGTKQIDTQAVMEGKIAVDYVSDLMSGDVTAFVWTEDREGNHTYRYTFKGNAAKKIPLSQRTTLATSLAMTSAPIILSGIGHAIGGSVGAIIGGSTGLVDYAKGFSGTGFGGFPLSGALKYASEYMPESIKQGGKTGSTIGAAAGRSAAIALSAGQHTTTSNADSGASLTSPVDTQCYLIIERPIWSAPENYRKLFGYPSDISGTISDTFEGFLSVRGIKLDNLTAATDDEKAEIYQLMASGVYVSDNFNPEERE